jgi:hypothetical protein
MASFTEETVHPLSGSNGMNQRTGASTILRIELWHGLLLLAAMATLGQSSLIDIRALLIGGIFMALNFFLLGFGVLWVLTPLAGRGRIRAGVSLLVLKIIIFLGLLMVIFFRFEIDGLSFALGFSTLILAVLVEGVAHSFKQDQ